MDNETQRPSRRTVLKVGAWSVPVIAAAAATPLAAASVAVDLQFIAMAGDGFSADNAEGTRRMTVSRPTRFTLSTASGTVPAGTTITVVYDNRHQTNATMFIVGSPDTPLATVGETVTNGARSTTTFTFPSPVTVDQVILGLDLDNTTTEPVFLENYAPMTVTATAPGLSDSDPANNSAVGSVEYEDLPLP